MEQKLDSLSQLKVKGLVLGPIHVAPPDEPMNLRFEEVSPKAGTLEQFKDLVQSAHRKGESAWKYGKMRANQDLRCSHSRLSGIFT